LCLRNRSILSLKIRRATIKGTGVRQASSPETEPNFYTMPVLSKCIEASGVQANSRKACVMDQSDSMADCSMSNARKIAPVHPVFILPYVYGNYVTNPPVEWKQTEENGCPSQLLPVDPRPPLLQSSTFSMHHGCCPEPTPFAPTVLVRSVLDEYMFNQRQQAESSASQSELDEADFEEFLRHLDINLDCPRPTTPCGVGANISSSFSTQSFSA
jgi:hypothetical protein